MKLRLGIIGAGNIAMTHIRNVQEGKCPDIEITAVADRKESRRQWAREQLPDAAIFSEGSELIAARPCDAVLIAVPHYQHPPLAIEALRAGLHVMCEKPAGVYTLQVREMMAEADKHPELTFGMMFNQRTNCVYRKIKQMLTDGELGEIKRVNWIVTDWYRTQYYYDSGAWRATWAGEGGGVLLNQAPHNLDLWQWICGMPAEVTAWCDVARYHRIEVEDDAAIFTRYENGATGAFLTSTGELPGTNRLEIAGDRGKLVLENGLLKWWRLPRPEPEIRFASQENFVSPDCEYEEIAPDAPETAHQGILANFAGAILRGEELLSPGADGLNELTISNAAYLSAWTGNRPVSLPMDEAAFDRLLDERAAKSVYKHGAAAHNPDGQYSRRWQVNW